MSVCLAAVASAEVFIVDGIKYSVSDDVSQTVSVVGWDKNYFAEINVPDNVTVGNVDDEDLLGPEDLVLPWRVLYNGLYYKVTAIDDDAFSECLSMKTLTIPNTIESIGSYAFQSCLNLFSVKVQWVTPLAIDESVFDGIDLSGVTLYVLQGYADAYKNADVWKDFKNVSTYADLDINMIFADPYVKELCVANWDTSGDGELSYREARAVTDLGATFVGDTNITSFDEFRSFGYVTSVGQACFKGCSNLKSITFPPSVTEIGSEAFGGCDALENVVLQYRLKTIDAKAFAGCAALKTVTFTSSSTSSPVVETIGDQAFFGCSSLQTINLSSLTKLVKIGDQAFAGCSSVQELALSKLSKLTTIGSHAFDGCASVKSFNIPAAVASIGEGAFANCSANTKLDVNSNNKTYIHNTPRTIIIDKATRTQFVAYACGATATSFTFPETVMEILPYAFAGSTNLASVSLSNVETIGHDAFANCGKLYTVVMPEKVAAIGDNAFGGIAKGIRVQVARTEPLSIGENTFSLAADAEEGGINGRLFVPAGSKDAYKSAMGWSWFSFIEEGTIAEYAAKIIQFADSATAAVCLAAFDADHDGYLTTDETAAVTSLGDAFKGAEIGSFDELKYFTSITAIEEEAFKGSTLKSITLPDNVTLIGAGAFADCAQLTVFKVPASVVNIGAGAFKGCTALTAINVDAENPSYSSGTSGVLFTKDHTTLIQYPANKNANSVIIPEGVLTIEPEAFAGAVILKGVTIANSVVNIGERAFADCAMLNAVKTYWPTPIEVPANTFENVNVANATLTVPNGSEEAYKAAEVWKDFGQVETFKLFVIFQDPDVEKVCVENWDTNGDGKLGYEEAAAVTTIGDAFKGNTQITTFKELTEFSKITEIPDEAFMGCSSLKSIAFPYGVRRIGNSAFEGCSVFTMPSLSSNLKEFGDRAFYGCDGLTTVGINVYIKKIGNGAFGNCSSLKAFTVSATNTEYVALDNIIFTKDTTEVVAYPAAKSATTFRVTKDYVKTIRPYAFSGAYHLKNLDLHLIDSIGDYAFENCVGLTQVEFTEGMRIIGEGAFSNCQSLQAIKIPANVEKIGPKAFEGMPLAVRCQVAWTTPLPIAEGTFSNFEQVGENQLAGILFVPEGTKSLYENAPGWDFFTLVYETDMSDYDATLITFTDPVVEQLAVAAWDTNGDHQLSYDEAAAVTALGEVFTDKKISSFNELKYFTSLTEIGDKAFRNTGLATVTMPEGIKRIGNSAFMGTSISKWNTLPELTEIGDSAFAYNDGFESLKLKDNIVKVGTGAFKGCPKLKSIGVMEENPNYWADKGILYDKTGTKLLQVPAASTTIKAGEDYAIDEKVTEIGEDAFLMVKNLTSVTIPLGVTSIKENAFRACTALDSVTVVWRTPLAVPANTFEGVDQANAVLSVPKGFENLYAETAVWKDFGRMNLYLDDAAIIEFEDPAVKALCVANWDLDADGELTVAEAKQVTTLGTVFAINTDANITKFNELQYFTGLKSITTNAFKNCTSLEEVKLPASITEIAYGAFTGCSSLKSLFIPANVTTIGTGPFTNCTSLEEFMVDAKNKKFTAVDGVLFDINQSNLVAYPCAKEGEYTVPETVTAISQYAFCGSQKLTRVRLPKTLKSIQNGTFRGCTALTSVNIPSTITNIGSFAFSECESLSVLKVAWEKPLSVVADVFRTTFIEDVRLYVPQGSKGLYESTNVWKDFKEMVEYPNCDVNEDGYADMLDAVDVVKFVVGKPYERFDEYLADFDDDQFVTVADAVLLTRMIADGKAAPNLNANPGLFDGEDIEESLTLTKDVNNVVSLCLESSVPYTAFQFDLTLPGVDEIELARLSGRKSGHQLMWNKVGEDTYRFAAISFNNNIFRDVRGAIVNIKGGNPDCDEIKATNIVFITADGEMHRFGQVMAAMPTGIAEVIGEEQAASDNSFYTLSGVRVERPGKGVYIVNGKKVIIK